MSRENDLATVGRGIDVYEAEQAALLDASDRKVDVLRTQVTDLQAASASADQIIAGLRAQVADKDRQIAALIQAELDEDAPPPPPPPLNRLAVGTSPGGSTAADLAQKVKDIPGCEVARVFLPGLPCPVAGNAIFAAAVAAKLEVWVSFGSMPSQALFQSCVTDWIKSGVAVWWTYHHEVDAPKEAAAQFVAEYDQLLTWAEAVPAYSASRVRDQAIFMGYLLDPKMPHGDPKTWMPKRMTRIGFDCYASVAVPRAMAFAKALGIPWVIPEIGAGGPNGEGGPGDDAALAFVQKAVAAWAAYPPQGVCWYASNQGNQAGTPLTSGFPKTVAYLSALAKT